MDTVCTQGSDDAEGDHIRKKRSYPSGEEEPWKLASINLSIWTGLGSKTRDILGRAPEGVLRVVAWLESAIGTAIDLTDVQRKSISKRGIWGN